MAFKDQFANHTLTPFQTFFVERVQELEDFMNSNAPGDEHVSISMEGTTRDKKALIAIFHTAADGHQTRFDGIASHRKVGAFHDIGLAFPSLGEGVVVATALEELYANYRTTAQADKKMEMFMKRLDSMGQFAAAVREEANLSRPSMAYDIEIARTPFGQEIRYPAPRYDARYNQL